MFKIGIGIMQKITGKQSMVQKNSDVLRQRVAEVDMLSWDSLKRDYRSHVTPKQ